MRRPAALVLALFPATLALACGSSPTESVGTSSEAIGVPTCPVGEHAYCDTNELTGRLFCTCVQNTCTYATPPAAPNGLVAWVAAWASPSVDGTCPVITTSTGRWAEIGDVIGPTNEYGYTNGVPNDDWVGPLVPSDCTQVPGMGSSCCTYVWWPDGYPVQGITVTSDLPQQDTQDLCPVNGATLVPLEQEEDIISPGSLDGGTKGPQPGSGGCGSCVQVKGP